MLQLNSLLVATVVIVAFSLLVYIAFQNWQTPIARALAVLLLGVMVVFGGTVLLNAPPTREATIQAILRGQWIGVALVPAGYIHLSHALLDYIGTRSARRRWLVVAAYAVSLAFMALALGSDLLVTQVLIREPLAILGPGPLFGLFVAYFALAGAVALRVVLLVRRTALTTTLRRRLTYLGATFIAPGLAVFPYLLVGGVINAAPPSLILFFSSLRNAAVAVMLVGLVYSIAFQGTLLPDRLIKQDFVRWLLYGPFVGVTTILFLRAVTPLANLLDLPQTIFVTFGVVVMSVLMPIFVARAKPYLDALIYTQDRAEIDYLRQLPRNTFTYADLRVLLENTLLLICGALRVETGFVIAPDEAQGYTVKTAVGVRRSVRQFVAEHELDDVMAEVAAAAPRGIAGPPPPEAFVRSNGFVLLALLGPDEGLLGAVGVAAPPDGLTAESRKLIGAIAHQMAVALSTVQTQQRLFDALRGMGPEMRSLQELTGRLEQATPAALEAIQTEVALLPEFPQLVKDALGQYWGGPKLSDSPLLELRTVRRQLTDQGGGSPTRALQAVLRQAIENLRPDAQLDPSAQEWVLYNILELRFLQGKRVSDTAERLAMSESDLYRKQRIAVEEVARQLALMEESASRT